MQQYLYHHHLPPHLLPSSTLNLSTQHHRYHPIKEATLHSIAYQLINLHTCSHIIITHTESELLTTGTIVL